MKIKVTRKIEFDAAHRVIGHENKCKYLHGHRYVLEVSFVTSKDTSRLDSLGRVIDFGVIKDRALTWVNDNLDHTTILSTADKELGDFLENYTGQKIYYLNSNPTAENIAVHLLKEILPELFKDLYVKISGLKLYETPNCCTKVKD
ncbi:MAG: 6-carboxytetrahydropterin synthase [Rickettsiaceae bacterium]|nr:6-carboxytetrahydropterin synthase [Rickettsiaceae bacterium]